MWGRRPCRPCGVTCRWIGFEASAAKFFWFFLYMVRLPARSLQFVPALQYLLGRPLGFNTSHACSRQAPEWQLYICVVGRLSCTARAVET